MHTCSETGKGSDDTLDSLCASCPHVQVRKAQTSALSRCARPDAGADTVLTRDPALPRAYERESARAVAVTEPPCEPLARGAFFASMRRRDRDLHV